MLKILRKLNVLLDRKQKSTMFLMVVMMIIGAILEACSISLVIPVIEVVIDENAVEKYDIVNKLYYGLHMQSLKEFALLIMGALILTFVVKNIYLYWQQKFMYRFVYTNQFRTSERMMKNYLRKGYEFYLNADTAVIQRNITSDVNNMYALILSILQLVSETIVFVFLLAVLLLSDWMMTAMIAVLLITTLWVIKSVIKPIMHKAGEDNQNYYSGLFKWISQTVQGIKEVKIAGKEQYFTDEYIKCGKGYVDAVQKYTLYNSIPRLLIETICIIGMVSYMMVLVATGRDFTQMMPILSAFSVAAIRLMPCANRINNQLTSIAFYQPFFMGVSDNLQDEISGKNTDMSFAKETDKKLPIHKSISMRDVTYHYPNSDALIFDHADMEIPIGASVGIVGASGAGKTTVVDILLGLLEVQTGGVYADDVNIKDEYRSWLKNVGYIPQLIFMLDDTILKNVAFGVPEDEIDMNRIWEVLKEAQMDEFVRGLPEGLNTGIGERGIRISGGQRQRLGIARALYYDP
ncbi:MAG: ATP-binding cassette domain-containing protein, partial [Lachnospiraceae bacterium]